MAAHDSGCAPRLLYFTVASRPLKYQGGGLTAPAAVGHLWHGRAARLDACSGLAHNCPKDSIGVECAARLAAGLGARESASRPGA